MSLPRPGHRGILWSAASVWHSIVPPTFPPSGISADSLAHFCSSQWQIKNPLHYNLRLAGMSLDTRTPERRLRKDASLFSSVDLRQNGVSSEACPSTLPDLGPNPENVFRICHQICHSTALYFFAQIDFSRMWVLIVIVKRSPYESNTDATNESIALCVILLRTFLSAPRQTSGVSSFKFYWIPRTWNNEVWISAWTATFSILWICFTKELRLQLRPYLSYFFPSTVPFLESQQNARLLGSFQWTFRQIFVHEHMLFFQKAASCINFQCKS